MTLSLKIAVSGSAGIGKSTLAAALAEHYQLPFIEENFDPLFTAGVIEGGSEQLVPAFFEILERKQELEIEAGQFVTDRCTIDLFHNWLTRQLDMKSNQTLDFLKRCHQQFNQYDFIVIPPWGSLPLQQSGEEQGPQRRAMNPMVQMRNHALIVGYTHMWVNKKKVIEIPDKISELDKRVQFVSQQIQLRQANLSKLK